VFAEPQPAVVLSAEGQPVRVSARGAVSTEPALLRMTTPTPGQLVVDAWAGPWPIDELWWDPQAARAVARFQLVAVDGTAWLLIVEDNRWFVEAQYD
jgi:protein ImuB